MGKYEAYRVGASVLSHVPVNALKTEIMLVDPSLWTTFHEAKSALLDTLRAIPTQQSHAFTASPESRESTRTSISELVSAISEVERELKVVQDEFAIAQNLLSQKRVMAKRSLSPIEALPPELICAIVSLSCEASDPTHTLRLSHIWRAWRNVVLSMQSLFTCADWNHWGPSLVQLWCTRAGTLPLTMQLGVDEKYGIIRRCCQRAGLLKTWIPQLERLDIDAEKPRIIDSEKFLLQEAFNHYLESPMPLLTHLRLRVEFEGGFPFPAVMFTDPSNRLPALRVLDLGPGIHFMFAKLHHWLKVASFSLSSEWDWHECGRTLCSLPYLEELAITLAIGFPVEIEQHMSGEIHLPSLKTLKIIDGPICHELPIL